MAKSKDVTFDCFKIQKFLLNYFGLLDTENVLHKVFAISFLISITTYIFSAIPEVLKVYYENFPKFILSVMFEICLFFGLICAYCAFWNRFEFKQLFENLQLLDELSNFENAESENVFIKEYKDVVRKQAYYGISWIIFIQIMLISTSVVVSLNKEKWILPFGSGSVIVKNDNIQFIFQIIMFGILLIAVYLLLIIFINVMTLICGHCKLLQKYIALSFTGYEGEIFQNLDVKLIAKKIPEWESFKVHLRNIVPYHVCIIDTAKQVEAVFSVIILTYFGGASSCVCLLIYHTQITLEIQEIIKDIFMLITVYSILIIVSCYGEKIATESEKIASACYELDFVGCDLRIQKSLLLIMAISQRPITPTIGKLKVLGLRTMLSIFQSIYSYYTILRNVINK